MLLDAERQFRRLRRIAIVNRTRALCRRRVDNEFDRITCGTKVFRIISKSYTYRKFETYSRGSTRRISIRAFLRRDSVFRHFFFYASRVWTREVNRCSLFIFLCTLYRCLSGINYVSLYKYLCYVILKFFGNHFSLISHLCVTNITRRVAVNARPSVWNVYFANIKDSDVKGIKAL